MRPPLKRAVALALLLAASGGALAHGHRGHAHGGVYIGLSPWPAYPPYRFYYPPYPAVYPPAYPPVVVTVPAPQPPVYVEQPAPAQPPQAAPAPERGWWYYCADSRAYYPYVSECPAGWQKVAPQPPGQ